MVLDELVTNELENKCANAGFLSKGFIVNDLKSFEFFPHFGFTPSQDSPVKKVLLFVALR